MSMHNEYCLSLPGELTIGITSTGELPLTENEELLLGAYLPGVKVLDVFPDKADVMLHHCESTDKGLTQGVEEIEVRDKWNNEFPADLPHLIYSIARSRWLMKGIYPVHAACIGDGTYTLMPGHSGVGKTSTALSVLNQGHQKLFSGNTTLIEFSEGNTLRAIAGTRTMTLKTRDFETQVGNIETKMEYGDRTAFLLDEEAYSNRPIVDIGRIALVQITDSGINWTKLEPAAALHILYTYFLDQLHSDTVIAGGEDLYIGYMSHETGLNLVRQLKHVLEEVDVFRGIGNKELLAGSISMS